MNNLYFKMARTNVKNNRSIYLPYIICEIIMVAMFYMLEDIHRITQNVKFYGDGGVDSFLMLAVGVTTVFSAIVIIYTNFFLQKKRLKEYGLYSMLGLEKRHIIKIVLWENLIVNVIGTFAGLVFGFIFSRFAFLLLDKLVGGNTAIGFEISGIAVVLTLVIYGIFFLFSNIINIFRILRLNPIELLRQTKAGEREPKAKWILAILGVASLGTGYYLALTVKNPMSAIDTFFIAVLLVIVGTYLLFICGIIALLKLLKKNKKFYYNRKHFITISGMLYRMKQNAAGLASICILSTAALITMFSVVTLYVGTEDSVNTMYPKDIELTVSTDDGYETNAYEDGACDEKLEAYAESKNIKISGKEAYYQYTLLGHFDGDKFIPEDGLSSDSTMLTVLISKDYQAATGDTADVNDNQALVYSVNGKKFTTNKITFGDLSLEIAGSIPKDNASSDLRYLIDDYVTLVVKDLDQIKAINDQIYENYVGDEQDYNEFYCSKLDYTYGFDIEGTDKDKDDFVAGLQEEINSYDSVAMANDHHNEMEDFMALYGSLFFIGIFIGILFIMATAVIIYYKQISEGYEDHDRFVIMEKVGMSQKEVKETIRSQILLVFFLPIIMAVIHVAVAFSQIKIILRMFGLINVPLMVGCLVATVVVYLIGYMIFYSATAKTYYKLVR